MISKLKEIILDNQSSKQNLGISRELELSRVDGKATILMGVRRSGKTTRMFQRIGELLGVGVIASSMKFRRFQIGNPLLTAYLGPKTVRCS